MSNQFLPKASPIWGFPMHFTVADLPSNYAEEIEVVAQTAVSVVSAAKALGARAVEIVPHFDVPGASCTIKLYTAGAPDVLIKTWTGVNQASEPLYAGNLEHVDLDGKAIKIEVAALDGGKVSVGVKVQA